MPAAWLLTEIVFSGPSGALSPASQLNRHRRNSAELLAALSSFIRRRTAAREKEIALRGALGATRFRLTRQLFTETFLLCALGTGVGLALAVYGVQFLRAIVPAVSSNYKVSIPGLDEIGIDRWVLAFTL